MRYFKIHFNEEAVVVMSRRHVPVYVKFVASLGKAFNFCQPLNSSSAIDLFVSMDKILSGCDRYDQLHDVRHHFNLVKDRVINGQGRLFKPTKPQMYIQSLMMRTNEFLRLKMNRNVIIVPADKGGKTVIMDKEDYLSKAYDHIKKNIIANNYVRVEEDYLSVIRPSVEEQYAAVISLISPYLLVEKYVRRAMDKLNLIASHLNQYNARDSTTIVPELMNFTMESSHRLCSLDYESMFTNVNVDEAFNIISGFYHIIAATTTVPIDIFMASLRFFTTSATFFAFDGNVYKQIRGLAMGNRLAQIVAEIRTNHSLHSAIKIYDATSISFIYKFVDDILSGIHEDLIDDVAGRISSDVGMKLTLTKENVFSEVEFLDCVFQRKVDGSLLSKWKKKDYSSMSILNYHSYHPWHMKYNVVYSMIKKGFALTSAEYLDETRSMFNGILLNSSYPTRFISDIIKKVEDDILTGSRDREFRTNVEKGLSGLVYVSCPYSHGMFKGMKAVIRRNGLSIRLAPRPSSNNRSLLFSRIKDKRQSLQLKNALFNVCCSRCSFAVSIVATHTDIRRTIKLKCDESGSSMHQHLSEFPGHFFSDDVKIVKVFSNIIDAQRVPFVLKDVKRLKRPFL